LLIPPVALKLASTGYRFAPLLLGLARLPDEGSAAHGAAGDGAVLVASTIAVLVTGVLLLAAGHQSDTLLMLHKVSFIVFAVVFASTSSPTSRASPAHCAPTGARRGAKRCRAPACGRCSSPRRWAAAALWRSRCCR